MKILVAADFHFDNWFRAGRELTEGAWSLLAQADAVIIAGDLVNDPENNLANAFAWFGRQLNLSKVWFVPGNHDYYRFHLQGDDTLAAICAKAGANFAQKSVLEFDGVQFLLCTLWSDFALTGLAGLSASVARRVINDYNYISKAEDRLHRIVPEDTIAIFHDHVAWLDAELGKPFKGRRVVVTHHGPHRAVAGDIDQLTPTFVSDLDWLIAKHAPELWLFGHTHRRLQADVGKTHIRNMSLGYSQEVPRESEEILLSRGMIDTRSERLAEPLFLGRDIVRDLPGQISFVTEEDMPGPVRQAFASSQAHATRPLIDGVEQAHYAHDWLRFCAQLGIA
ncbi:metallophosphoesterase [Paracoccus litorisediminis]|uniref:metallophosphoesterase family protein n=1 Tax=Paracoccus litorisediminis TaxID=2006130 RepID=UPI00373330DC